MKKSVCVVLLFCLAPITSIAQDAPETPEMPKPTKEHEWLLKFVGEWEMESEVKMDPSGPPVAATATESVRSLGGFWIIAEGETKAMGMSFSYIMSLGYDPDKKRYVGTWIDSMNGYLWVYDGSLDSTGKILTLEAEGPCPTKPGEMSKFKDITEFKSPDHRVFSSKMQDENGEWVTFATGHSRRKK